LVFYSGIYNFLFPAVINLLFTWFSTAGFVFFDFSPSKFLYLLGFLQRDLHFLFLRCFKYSSYPIFEADIPLPPDLRFDKFSSKLQDLSLPTDLAKQLRQR